MSYISKVFLEAIFLPLDLSTIILSLDNFDDLSVMVQKYLN